MSVVITASSSSKVTVKMMDTTNLRSFIFSDLVSGATSLTTAGWIIYPDDYYLAEFSSPITFGWCAVVDSGVKLSISSLSGVEANTLVDGNDNVMASISALSGGGTTFSITFASSD